MPRPCGPLPPKTGARRLSLLIINLLLRKLGLGNLPIDRAALEQFPVGAEPYLFPAVEHQNPVGMADGRNPLRYNQNGGVLRLPGKSGAQLSVCLLYTSRCV